MIGCLWTCVHKQPIITLYFEFENELKFYILKALLLHFSIPQVRCRHYKTRQRTAQRYRCMCIVLQSLCLDICCNLKVTLYNKYAFSKTSIIFIECMLKMLIKYKDTYEESPESSWKSALNCIVFMDCKKNSQT